tara:strand:+ start:331 stop:1308 length:978 start_codon:yes stop_codon:yes gene_type:complete
MSKFSRIAHIITDQTISVFADGKEWAVKSNNINFAHIKAALNENDLDRAIRLMDPNQVIHELGNENLTSSESEGLRYKGDPVDPSLHKRLLEILHAGHEPTCFINFMDNLYENPSKRSREELYRFIAHHGMPITPEGTVIGYKGVSHDYMDRHSGTWSNKVGVTNTMKRRDVDDDCNVSCGAGFHLGSKSYADNWGGSDGHLMACEFNPAHAVSIPLDCNSEKCRVWEYSIVAEIFDRSITFDKPLYKVTENGVIPMKGDGIIQQKHSDNFYKASNYIETARDNGKECLGWSSLEHWDLSDEERDELIEYCDLAEDMTNPGLFWL